MWGGVGEVWGRKGGGGEGKSGAYDLWANLSEPHLTHDVSIPYPGAGHTGLRGCLQSHRQVQAPHDQGRAAQGGRLAGHWGGPGGEGPGTGGASVPSLPPLINRAGARGAVRDRLDGSEHTGHDINPTFAQSLCGPQLPLRPPPHIVIFAPPLRRACAAPACWSFAGTGNLPLRPSPHIYSPHLSQAQGMCGSCWSFGATGTMEGVW